MENDEIINVIILFKKKYFTQVNTIIYVNIYNLLLRDSKVCNLNLTNPGLLVLHSYIKHTNYPVNAIQTLHVCVCTNSNPFVIVTCIVITLH